jgi:D-beta-D-heptose 7-phosphate kinase/D-beta-D-heptose 1-phosphate adenosyltransferase
MMNMSEGLDGLHAMVIGDLVLDRALEGRVRWMSSPEREAPVVVVEREWSRAGGAGGVAAAMAGLGARVKVVGLTGDDDDGATLRRVLELAGVESSGIAARPSLATISRARALSEDGRTLFRVDRGDDMGVFVLEASALFERALARVPENQLIVMSDHGRGALPSAQARALIASCRERAIPCVAETRGPDLAPFQGVTALAVVADVEGREHTSGWEPPDRHAVAALRSRLGVGHLLIDRGVEGLTLAWEGGCEPITVASSGLRPGGEGPGAAVAAILAACLAIGRGVSGSLRLASIAAGPAVGPHDRPIVRNRTREAAAEVRRRKVLDRESAHRWGGDQPRDGPRGVFSKCCFDILHAGHLASLEQAREFGDALIVGLNSDASVRANKGPTRPINRQDHRAALLAGLTCVDAVVLFDEETPEDLIRRVEPDVLVKGGDYDALTIVGSEFVRGRGGEVRIIPLVDNLSTTRVLDAYLRDL